MSIQIQIVIIIFAFLLLLFIFELLRRRKLTEAITLWWLFIIFLAIFLTLNQFILNKVRDFLGVALPISVLLMLSLFFVLTMLIYFSMKVSVLSEQIRTMAQDIAIFKADPFQNSGEKKINGDG